MIILTNDNPRIRYANEPGFTHAYFLLNLTANQSKKLALNQGSTHAWSQVHYTPRLWRVGCNSFGIVCVSVCPSVSLSRLNGQTYKLEFWHGHQVEEYLGQGHRSKVKVTRSKNVPWCVCSIDLWELFSMDLPLKKLSNTTGRNTRNTGMKKAVIQVARSLEGGWYIRHHI